MTIEEMKETIKKAGWTLHQRKRYNTTYVYASRREGAKVSEVYLTKLESAKQMSPEALTTLLQKKVSQSKK